MNTEVAHKLGTHTPIFCLKMKGWLFAVAWGTHRLRLAECKFADFTDFVFSGTEPPFSRGGDYDLAV